MKEETGIKSFEGLRGLAALLVAIYHFNGFLRPGTFVDSFYLLVDLFFIMSGFVIFRAYHNKLSSLRSLGNFTVRRIGRLYPLHLFAAVFFVAATCASRLLKIALMHFGLGAALGSPDSTSMDVPGLADILTNLFLLQGIGPFSHNEINGPSWSISTEFYTYLVLAFGAYLFRGQLRNWVFAGIAAAGLGLAIYGSIEADGCLRIGRCLDSHLEYAFPRCLGGFFLGVFAEKLTTSPGRLSSRELTAAQLLATGLTVFIMWKSVYTPAYAFFTIFGFFALILSLARDQGPIARILKTRPFQFLGKISYSIYLIHAPFVFIGHLTLRPLPVALKFLILLVYITTVVLISTQTFRFIEAPARRVARKLSNQWFGDRPAQSSARPNQLPMA